MSACLTFSGKHFVSSCPTQLGGDRLACLDDGLCLKVYTLKRQCSELSLYSFQLGQISIGLVFDKANRIFPHIFKGYSRPHFLLKNSPPQEMSHGWLLLLEVWRAVERGPLPFQRLQLLQAVLRFDAGALQ